MFFLHHLESIQPLLASIPPASAPLIKVHLIIEVSKAKAVFLKTALSCGEREPASLRATVNNADTRHPSSSCHIQNEGGELGGFKGTETEDKLTGELIGGQGSIKVFFRSPLPKSEDIVVKNESAVQCDSLI